MILTGLLGVDQNFSSSNQEGTPTEYSTVRAITESYMIKSCYCGGAESGTLKNYACLNAEMSTVLSAVKRDAYSRASKLSLFGLSMPLA